MAESSNGFSGAVLLVAALGMGWVIFGHGCGSSATPEETAKEAREKTARELDEKRTTPGYVGRLDGEGRGTMIPLGRTAEDYTEVSKSLQAKDDVGFANLTVDGRTFSVKAGTQAKTLDWDWGKIRVRILEGEHKDEDGWTAQEFMK